MNQGCQHSGGDFGSDAYNFVKLYSFEMGNLYIFLVWGINWSGGGWASKMSHGDRFNVIKLERVTYTRIIVSVNYT